MHCIVAQVFIWFLLSIGNLWNQALDNDCPGIIYLETMAIAHHVHAGLILDNSIGWLLILEQKCWFGVWMPILDLEAVGVQRLSDNPMRLELAVGRGAASSGSSAGGCPRLAPGDPFLPAQISHSEAERDCSSLIWYQAGPHHQGHVIQSRMHVEWMAKTKFGWRFVIFCSLYGESYLEKNGLVWCHRYIYCTCINVDCV